MKRIKMPFEFEVFPDNIKTGNQWVSVQLKNIGTSRLTQLDVKLHSNNPSLISILGTGKYIGEINIGDTETVPFKVEADVSTYIYATVSGYKNEDYFFWLSPRVRLDVDITTARLNNVFALTHPHVAMNDTIKAEALIEGVTGGEGFNVEFWHDSPYSLFEDIPEVNARAPRIFEKIADVSIEKLFPGEVKRPSIEFTPNEKGVHEIHVYLYDNKKYIGCDKDTVYVC